MPLFNWPYTNLHSLNLDWIIKKIKNVETAETNTAASKEAAAGSAASAAESEANAAASETNAAASATAAGNYYNHIRDNVSTLVTGWMDEHITPTTPPVDDTLTIQGAAADAQVTGNKITDLKNATNSIKNMQTYRIMPVYVEGHGINASGVYATSSKRMATPDFINLSGAKYIEYNVAEGYRLSIAFYSEASESSFISARYWLTERGRIKAEGQHIRITCSTVTESNAITLSESTNFIISVDIPIVDVVKESESEIDGILNTLHGKNVSVPLTWMQGTASTWSMQRIHAGLIDVSRADTVTIFCGEGMQYYLSYYDSNHEYVIGRGWYSETKTFVPEYPYFYVMLSYVESANISPIDYTENMLTVSYQMDTLLNDIDTSMKIPTYWDTALETAISSIHTNEETSDAQGDSFVFITDTHWSNNAKHSPALIHEIKEKTNVKNIVFGGDALTLYPTKAEALEVGRSFYNAFKNGGMHPFSVLGNHDVNNNQSTYGQDAYLTYPQVYSYMFKSIENDACEMPKWSDTNGDVNRNFYYYIDNETQKIRYIFLNNGRARIGNVQKTWFQSKITELPTGWTVITFAHRYWIGVENGVPTLDGAYGTDIVTAINEVYDTANAVVGALIVGHCHYDYSITTEKGYPVIATTTDCYRLSNTALSPTMTEGTDTEQAFDVFSIDTTNRKLYAVRVGAGSGREWTY